ncbi:MAG: NADH-quinone oxidoreductase subunit J [Schwartzia sp.]|nr:NADH-quinone oxidoreductase subunit J [Schwartzia sp. (in: firmicutes)]
MDAILEQVHGLVAWALSLASEYDVESLIEAGVFFLFAGLALLFACGVIFFRNVVHSALSLTATFIFVACLYLSIGAAFMGAVQILVYGGAVAVLIVMAIMLTRRDDMAHSNPSRGLLRHALAAAVTGLFFLGMAAVAVLSPFRPAPQSLGDAAPGLADLMLTHYVLPFEVAAVLLLMAMIGAIVLAKGADES